MKKYYAILRIESQFHLKEIEADSFSSAIQTAFTPEEIEKGRKIIIGEIGPGFDSFKEALKGELS